MKTSANSMPGSEHTNPLWDKVTSATGIGISLVYVLIVNAIWVIALLKELNVL